MSVNELKAARVILKALGEDNRLRIVNLLHKQSLNVAELCEILGTTQSNVSKHLARLRLTGIVHDRRDGQFIYYHLSKPGHRFHESLLKCVIKDLSGLETFREDLARLEKLSSAKGRSE